MNEVFTQLVTALTSVWRRRWYVVAIAWLICGVGWTMVASLPDKYESSARVYVDMDTMLGPLMKGIAVEMNVFQQIDLMQRTLFSRPNLEKIVLLTDLDLHVNTAEQKEAVIEGLRAKLGLLQQGRNLFKVTYEDSDPALAKRVVQAVLQIFVEGNLGASRQDMDTARRFLQDQITEYEKQLVAAENRMAEFKQKHIGMLPGNGTHNQRLAQVQKAAALTAAQLAESKRIRDSLKEQLAKEPRFFETSGSANSLALTPDTVGQGPESDSAVEIFELERILENLLIRYTPQHPDVISTQRRIDELKKKMENEKKKRQQMMSELSEMDAPQASNAETQKAPNPVYDQIKLQLVKQEAVVAALERRLKTRNEELAKMQEQAKTAPQVEAQLAALNRDYQIIRKGYDALRQRQESARMARDLETKAQKVQFRIIDPPRVPLKPSGPNRPLFLSVVLIAGVATGIMFAFLLGQINSAFSSVQALRQAIALPVVGSVTAIMSSLERRRRLRELISFGLVCVGLFVAFGGLLTVEVLHRA